MQSVQLMLQSIFEIIFLYGLASFTCAEISHAFVPFCGQRHIWQELQKAIGIHEQPTASIPGMQRYSYSLYRVWCVDYFCKGEGGGR